MQRNVLLNFTLRSLARNRARTLVTVLGITLACGLITAIYLSWQSLLDGAIHYEMSTQGSWHMSFMNADDTVEQRLRDEAGEHLAGLSDERILGAASLPVNGNASNAPFITLVTLTNELIPSNDTSVHVINEPAVDEGRLPTQAGEIALPVSLRGTVTKPGASQYGGAPATFVSADDKPLALGSRVIIAPGIRTLDTPATAPNGDTIATGKLSEVNSPVRDDSGVLLEHLSNIAEPRTYTVVGFTQAKRGRTSTEAFVQSSEAAFSCGQAHRLWVTTRGFATTTDLEKLAQKVTGTSDAAVAYHTSLLTMTGYDPDRSDFRMISQIVNVLAAIVVIAAVSLISNAFNISLAERTRQFGLLSSLGASRAQLSLSICYEVAVLGVVGIPLGLLVGIGGTAAVFALVGKGLGVLISGSAGGAMPLVITPAVLLTAAGISLVCLVISAAFPAVRASRLTAIDALRQKNDVRITRGLKSLLKRRASAAASFAGGGTRPRGLWARLFGMPGFLTRRSRVATPAKARVAVASLAVSLALVVAAGILNEVFNIASFAQGSQDGDGVLMIGPNDHRTEDGPVQVDFSSAPLDMTTALLAEARSYPEIEQAIALSKNSALVQLPANQIRQDLPLDPMSQGLLIDKNGWSDVTIALVDDASWEAIAEAAGASSSAADAHPVIALSTYYARGSNSSYTIMTDAFTPAKQTVPMVYDPSRSIRLYYGIENNQNVVFENGVGEGAIPKDPASYPTIDLSIVGTIQQLPDTIPYATRSLAQSVPVFIAPASAFRDTSLGYDRGCEIYFKVREGVPASGTQHVSTESLLAKLSDKANELRAADLKEGRPTAAAPDTFNLHENRTTNMAITQAAQVFIWAFSIILITIAIANVFNTISSAMALREREIAVLRSCGMSQHSLTAMVALECCDYVVRGLIWGMLLSAGAYVAMRNAITTGINGYELPYPWLQLGLATAIVFGVLIITVAYALSRMRSLNVIGSLRNDLA